ncbi:hypothetical protein AVEN_176228-1 [Araneus ventricosus]|uniref:Uncharacterized protein n=1 Tax=Araneus ventricosus TaxID=182803 RepID=A0A4Y2WXZ8_ARAVE|nr:hypothetical protein AVEN_151422-1 [Araneus ventricosus]GBO41696.1 hypothetical protein AVEN_176228-1 [Araneus ventricosus]
MEDAGFQLLNDEEIIAEVRHSPKDDEEEDNDEGLAWLEQQEQFNSSKLMLLRKLRDRATRQKMTNLLQMKLPFKSL